ncbi:TPA: flagellar hook-basal body complex protein FliE [Candidatus Poribacteria bacterium]|jgi:flagellar hook-basal body complex protein FliE|nr:flagellar hook-basal body complex protein FliE [Candidatus Poribacteria bacterium]HIA66000.1 flagellar hook-basal body complex protein FliE [Candidatus Poribacteria bacterium]HIB89872.1 flagellar hook-basal body complex protein FliE [Candidatus Poribacteria bacterium]HIN31736.1 flagellar hook-basal body complex protein FliE [Candidatus Poribacteria bacterium]
MKLQRTLTPISPKLQKNDVKNTKSDQQTGSFSETLTDSMEEVNQLQKEADRAIEALATGETKDIAQTMIAVEKANVSFQLMTQVRNRLVEAYQEVLRMQS